MSGVESFGEKNGGEPPSESDDADLDPETGAIRQDLIEGVEALNQAVSRHPSGRMRREPRLPDDNPPKDT